MAIRRNVAFTSPAGDSVRTKTVGQADKILAAAAQLFASHHFHQARMEDIADLAEVGKGTLYRYFKDKEELYMALLSRVTEDWTERTCAAAEVQAPAPNWRPSSRPSSNSATSIPTLST